jgi:hypothetical protein
MYGNLGALLIFYKALDELDLMKMIQKILNLKYGRY